MKSLSVKKFLAGCMAISMTVMSFAGTVSAEEVPENIKDEIHFATIAAPPTLDIQMITNITGKMIGEYNIFEKLVEYDSENQIYPVLADSFEVNDDNTEYTYHLRSGVKFHDGTEMTADDVVASMNRWIENVSSAGSLFGDSRFEKVDDATVKVTLASSSIFVNDMIAGAQNGAVVYPASVIENADPDTGYITEYIGTGPYKFVEWQPDQYVLLEKNEDYTPAENGAESGCAAATVPVTEKLYYEFVPDDATRVAGVQTGEYDMIYKAPYDNYEMLSADDSLDIYNSVYGNIYMVFNKKTGIGTNEKFRQAVQMALNDEEILMGAYSTPEAFRVDGSYMLQEQTTWYNDEAAATYNVNDADGAKALLDEAGYSGDTFRLLVSPDYSDMYNSAIVIQAELSALGVNVELVTADWATYTAYRSDETMYDAFITTGPFTTIPTSILYLSSGWAGWATDEKLQEMMGELNRVPSEEEGVKLWSEIQSYCSNEYVPACKLGDIYRYSVSTAKLRNVEMGSFAPLFWNAYIEE